MTELPWDRIATEVLRAVRASNEGRKFVASKHIAEHIHDNTEKYPLFKNCTYQTTQGRVSTVLADKIGWERYNCRGGKKPGVFINPKVKDDITDTSCVGYAKV